jgi:hypothetical protein
VLVGDEPDRIQGLGADSEMSLQDDSLLAAAAAAYNSLCYTPAEDTGELHVVALLASGRFGRPL